MERPNYFILLEIPAFHLLVFAARKHVRMAVGNRERRNSVDVARESNFQFSLNQIPELDCAIARP